MLSHKPRGTIYVLPACGQPETLQFTEVSMLLPSASANEVPSHLVRWFGKLSLNQPAFFFFFPLLAGRATPTWWVVRILQQSGFPPPLSLFLLFLFPTKAPVQCPTANCWPRCWTLWHWAAMPTLSPQVGVKLCRTPAFRST